MKSKVLFRQIVVGSLMSLGLMTVAWGDDSVKVESAPEEAQGLWITESDHPERLDHVKVIEVQSDGRIFQIEPLRGHRWFEGRLIAPESKVTEHHSDGTVCTWDGDLANRCVLVPYPLHGAGFVLRRNEETGQLQLETKAIREEGSVDHGSRSLIARTTPEEIEREVKFFQKFLASLPGTEWKMIESTRYDLAQTGDLLRSVCPGRGRSALPDPTEKLCTEFYERVPKRLTFGSIDSSGELTTRIQVGINGYEALLHYAKPVMNVQRLALAGSLSTYIHKDHNGSKAFGPTVYFSEDDGALIMSEVNPATGEIHTHRYQQQVHVDLRDKDLREPGKGVDGERTPRARDGR